uniref:CID domain-containing protein n=1 Tax=Rhabditophanes sp. KR3021 TaxID=114890 RepID=A0AC35UFE9_9BILA
MVYESNEEEISTVNIIRPGTIENNYLLWKCYSIACGESIDKWSTKGVRIFEKGPIFVPPSPKFKLWKEMPEFLYKTAFNYKQPTAEESGDKILLNGGDKEKLKRILENTDLSHDQIAKGCRFLVEHVGECKDVIGQIKNTLTSLNVPFVCINICYIISDVMFYAKNCKEQNLQSYLTEFGIEIEFIFGLIFKYYDSLTCQEVKSNLRVKITKVLYFWGNKEIFDSQLILKFINKLHNINKDMPESTVDKPILKIGSDIKLNIQNGKIDPLKGNMKYSEQATIKSMTVFVSNKVRNERIIEDFIGAAVSLPVCTYQAIELTKRAANNIGQMNDLGLLKYDGQDFEDNKIDAISRRFNYTTKINGANRSNA